MAHQFSKPRRVLKSKGIHTFRLYDETTWNASTLSPTSKPRAASRISSYRNMFVPSSNEQPTRNVGPVDGSAGQPDLVTLESTEFVLPRSSTLASDRKTAGIGSVRSCVTQLPDESSQPIQPLRPQRQRRPPVRYPDDEGNETSLGDVNWNVNSVDLKAQRLFATWHREVLLGL